jgi:hypothetical protein
VSLKNGVLMKSVEQRHIYARHLYDSRERWWLALIVANGVAGGWLTTNKYAPPMVQDLIVSSMMLGWNLFGFYTALYARKHVSDVRADIGKALSLIDPALSQTELAVANAFPKRAYSVALYRFAGVFGFACIAWLLAIGEALYNKRPPAPPLAS